MTYSVPVIAPARGETRKLTRSATSPGFAGRPMGMPPSEFIKPFLRGTVVRAIGLGQSLDHPHRSFSLDPARRHPDHTDALRADLLGQALAVVGERGLGCRIGKGGPAAATVAGSR
jgi:hypothetical protein